MNNTKFSIRWDKFVTKLFYFLVCCEISIFNFDILFNHYKISNQGPLRRLFNITREDGISNFFSSFQLLAVSFVLLAIYFLSKKIHQGRGWIEEKGWLILAAFFGFMGFDDATKFHERIGTFAKNITSGDSSIFNVFPSYAWQVVFGPFFFGMGIFILWFLLKSFNENKTRYLFIFGLSFYVLAVGMDFIEGMGEAPYEGLATSLDLTAKQVRHLSKAFEESFEMFGTTLFLTAFLRHLFTLASLRQPLQFFFSDKTSV